MSGYLNTMARLGCDAALKRKDERIAELESGGYMDHLCGQEL